MGMCKKCTKITGFIFLIVGILFLLVDLGAWTFWGIQWWTALFLIWGIVKFAKSGCAACNSCCAPSGDMKKK